MKTKKDTSWLFLIIGVIVGIIFMNLNNKKKEDPVVGQPIRIPINVKDISVVFIVSELRDMDLNELSARLDRITKLAIRERPDDIRGDIEERLDELMRDHNTGKIILDL